MFRQPVITVLSVCLLASWVQGRNMLRGPGGTIVLSRSQEVMWGIELDPQLQLPDQGEVMGGLLQPWAVHGVNSVGFSLHNLDQDGPFFSRDGRSCDPDAVEQFTRFVSHVYGHRFGAVVSLFSAERENWLGSPQAYRDAAQTIAKRLPKYQSVIFIAGDLFGSTAWSPQCPYCLNDPAKAIELCRIILKTDPEALVGIPANIVKRPAARAEASSLFYAAGAADALERLVATKQTGRASDDWAGEIAVVDADHFLCRREVKGNLNDGIHRYLERVERDRLAIRPPRALPEGPGREDILTAEEKSAGWVALFDGRTLEGWTTLLPHWGHWSVEDGAIKCAAGPGPWPWLRSRKRYESFILRLEYNIQEGGNSGVFVWAPLDGRSSRFGMEVQLIGTKKAKPDKNNTPAAIYAVLAPREHAGNPPGEWNHLEIICRGSKVGIRLNDRLVQDFDANEVPALRNRLRKGVIGLQDHGSPVRFRNIRIKELDSDTEQ